MNVMNRFTRLMEVSGEVGICEQSQRVSIPKSTVQSGKILSAYSPPRLQERTLSSPQESCTTNTITDSSFLREELLHIIYVNVGSPTA